MKGLAIPFFLSGAISAGLAATPVATLITTLAATLIPPLAAQDPAVLQVRVVEGEGAAYAMGSRATRGIAVQVTDETGRPVEGATVSFRLPDDGPSGTFTGGTKTEIAMTRLDGRAAAWGMRWNRTAGLLEIRVTAVKGKTRAGIVCSQYLTNAPAAAVGKSPVISGSHKWLWVAVAVAGAAGGAVAAVALGGKAPATTASAVSVQINAPTITLGHP
jgi:hypothetical protein